MYQHSRYQKKKPGKRDKNISNHRPGEKEKILKDKKKEKANPVTPLKKMKRYAVSWSKEN